MYAGGGAAAGGRGADIRTVSAGKGDSAAVRAPDGEEECGASEEAWKSGEPEKPEGPMSRREELAKRVREANHFSVHWPR